MLFIVGIIKVGIVYNNYLTLNDAVRAGTRQFAMGRGTPMLARRPSTA